MDNNQQNASQAFQDYKTRIGHYSTLTEALAAAMLKGNLVWRIYDETREPYDLVEIYNFAKKYDQEHPITGTQFYWVSREGAIGISMGLEYRVKWLFIPMEPGLELDDLVVKMGEKMVEVEDVKAALNTEAEATSIASHSNQPSQPAMPQQQPVQHPALQPGQQPVQLPIQQPVQQPAPHPVQQPALQPVQQPALQPVQQPVQQPMRQSVQQPVQRPIQQPVQQPAPQPVQQPVQQPIQQPVQQPAPQPVQQPVQQPIQQPVQQPVQQPAAKGGKSKLPMMIGGIVAGLLIVGGGYFAYNHFMGNKETPTQQEEVTTTAATEGESQTTEPATQPTAQPAGDAKALTAAAVDDLKSATTAQQGIDKLNQAIDKGGKESVEALYTLAQLYGRVYSDKTVLANVEKLLPKDSKKAHELNEKAVSLDPTYYPSLYELGCDYMAGDARGAVERDIEKAREYFTKGIKYAQQANDTQLAERFEIRLSSLE